MIKLTHAIHQFIDTSQFLAFAKTVVASWATGCVEARKTFASLKNMKTSFKVTFVTSVTFLKR